MRNKAFNSLDSIAIVKNALSHLNTWLPGQMPPLTYDTSGPSQESQTLEFYRHGPINDHDLSVALASLPHLQAGQTICTIGLQAIKREALYRCALWFDFSPLPTSQLHWLMAEKPILSQLQTDLPPTVRQQLLAGAADEAELASGLWAVLMDKLGQEQDGLHCEALLELSPEQAEQWLAQTGSLPVAHEDTQQQARIQWQALLDKVGTDFTFGGLLLALSGIDILKSVNPQLNRIYASGTATKAAAWPIPLSGKSGLYAAWRTTLHYDANLFLHELPGWQQVLLEMPDEPLATLAYQLTELGIAPLHWPGYLHCLLLELPAVGSDGLARPDLADYLAIRLTLDRLWLNQACRDLWKVEANLDALQAYFNKNLSELMVRQHLYQGGLPEYLTHKAEALIIRAGSERSNREDWQQLADLIQTWQISPMAQCQMSHSKGNSVWRLFRLCQHLGLTPTQITGLAREDLLALLSVLDGFVDYDRNAVWQAAYQHHYREALSATAKVAS